MTLSIKPPEQPVTTSQLFSKGGATYDNPYELTPEEAAQMAQWEAMPDDEKGQFIHESRQELEMQDFIARDDYHQAYNDNVVYHLANGGVQVNGQLRPDAIINVGGMEMTVQQAIDADVVAPDAIGKQTTDILTR